MGVIDGWACLVDEVSLDVLYIYKKGICLEERLPLPDGEGLEVEDEALPGEGLLREGGHLYALNIRI